MELKFKHLTAALLMAGIACTQASAKDLYLSATGDDSKDGLTAETAVKTLGRLNEIMEKKATIYVSGMIDVSVEKPETLPADNQWNGKEDGGGKWVSSNSGKYQGFNLSSRDETRWQGLTFIGEDPKEDGFTGDSKTPLFILRGQNEKGTKFDHIGFINGISNIDGGTLVFRDEAIVEFNNCYFAGHHPDWNSFELSGNAWKRIGGDNEKGGAIRTEGNCQLSFNNCLFENNAARQGGAMFISGTAKNRECSGWINVKDCIFRDNSAYGAVDGIKENYIDDSHGGAITVYALNQEVYLNIDGCLFENNATFNDAGAIYLWDNTRYGHYCDITISNSSFIGNRSNNGGAILFGHASYDQPIENKDYITTRKVKILNTTFLNNHAKQNGGAFYFHGAGLNVEYADYPTAELWMVNVTMVGNETEGNSGHGAGYKAENYGATALVTNAKRHFWNCIFEGNYARHYNNGEPTNKEASDFCYAADYAPGLDIQNCYFGRMLDPGDHSNLGTFLETIGVDESSKIGYCVAYPKEGQEDVLFLANDVDAMNIFNTTRDNVNGPHLPFIPLPDESELKTAGNAEWLKMEDTELKNPVNGILQSLSGFDITAADQMGFAREEGSCSIGAAEAFVSEIMEKYGIESLIPAEPVAPELPELITDGLDIDEEFIKGEDKVSILFKEVEGIDIYYLIGEKAPEVADEAADEAGSIEETEDACTADHTGYTKYDGNAIELTNSHSTLTVFACDPKNSLHSEAKTYKLEIATGIEGIEAVANSKALYFNLQGVQVENPENGVFIRVSNGKATKVVK